MLWRLGSEEASKGVQRGQSCITRSNAVVALDLQGHQELRHMLRGKSVETEIFESLIAVAGDETQEQDQGVAIAANGVQTHAAERRQILAEELLHSQAKVVGARAFPDELPLLR